MAQVESQMTHPDAGMLPAGQTLDKVVSPATFALVSERVKSLGLPIEPLKRFKPWALALTLLGLEWQEAGFDAELGLDKHFYDQAVAAGKEVQGLETIEFQISRFDGMSMEEQDRMLASTLEELETEKASVTTLANAWKAGDAPTVERIVLQELRKEPAMYQRLLVDRNRDWLPKIEALFARKGRAFVVVGAAHLVGPTACSRCSRPRATRSSSSSVAIVRRACDVRRTLTTALARCWPSSRPCLRSSDRSTSSSPRLRRNGSRQNPNQAASTRFFTGEEQRQFERQITPLTPEWRRRASRWPSAASTS